LINSLARSTSKGDGRSMKDRFEDRHSAGGENYLASNVHRYFDDEVLVDFDSVALDCLSSGHSLQMNSSYRLHPSRVEHQSSLVRVQCLTTALVHW
jgi:hypothetical protein